MSLFSSNPKFGSGLLKDSNYYFYFTKDQYSIAEKLKKIFTAQGYSVHLSWFDYRDGQWSLILNKQVSGLDEALDLDKGFREIAGTYGVNYDGHEIEL
jgi:hypothetical protein